MRHDARNARYVYPGYFHLYDVSVPSIMAFKIRNQWYLVFKDVFSACSTYFGCTIYFFILFYLFKLRADGWQVVFLV